MKWSLTHRAWHIPYTKAAFDQLKTLFPDIEFQKNKAEILKNKESNNTILNNNPTKKSDVFTVEKKTENLTKDGIAEISK